MAAERLKRQANVLVRAVLSIALIGGLAYKIGSAEILAQMQTVRPLALLIVVILLASHVLIVTPRWASILGALGYRRTSFALIGSVFLGFLFNQVLPTAVGGDVVRVWRARQLEVPLDISIHSVLIDRASGIVVVLVAVMALLPLADPAALRSGLSWMVGTLTVGGLAACAALWAVGAARPLPIRIIAGVQRAAAAFNISVSRLAHSPRE